jgi:hypothetical protein
VKQVHLAYHSTLVFIRCDGSGRLYASLVGQRSLVPDFYKMKASKRPTSPNRKDR